MQAAIALGAGFADPILQSQAAFRAVLAAMAEPGLVQDLGSALAPPPGLPAAATTVLLTLADYETPLWLPERLRDGPAGAWLRFHCAAPLVAEPGRALFAVLDGADAPALAAFHPGEDQFPDRAATVIVPCAGFEGGPAVMLEGPGIPGSRSIAPAGLRPGFWGEVAANAALYPLGIDMLLVHGTRALGLPRSTQVREV
jgi:alpha-D-ribose 1-methylphosphonate 5-triphosphate synthase subunit PhnH